MKTYFIVNPVSGKGNSLDEITEKLGFTPTGPTEDWFGFTTYTAGGGVNTMRIGGRDYSGTELRVLLGLRSTAFSVSAILPVAISFTMAEYF